MFPRLTNVANSDYRVGLRPARSRVRIEIDKRNSKVVYAYGTGGSGWTFSYGVAKELVELIGD